MAKAAAPRMPATTAATLPARAPLEREAKIRFSLRRMAGRARYALLRDVLLVFIGMNFPRLRYRQHTVMKISLSRRLEQTYWIAGTLFQAGPTHRRPAFWPAIISNRLQSDDAQRRGWH